jgi:lipopolysaccharide heptosyltransferase II
MFRTVIESMTLIFSAVVQKVVYHGLVPLAFNPKRILVIKLDHLGDVLLATPVFSNLRRFFPEAEIDALVGEWGSVALRHHPDVDSIIQYNARFFCRDGRPSRLGKSIRLFRKLYRREYNLLVELRGDWLTAGFALFGATPYRLSRASLQLASKLGSDRFSSYHERDRNLDVLQSAHIPTPLTETTFYSAPGDRTWVDNLLDGLGIDASRPLIAIHPGSPIALKRWLPERYSELADWLIAQKRAQILFVGVKDEIPITTEIQARMRGESINIAGKTTLTQLASILHTCNVFIGNDSGPMHLAAAVGTQTIGLYGPGDPTRFGPAGTKCQTIQRKSDCPCLGTVCRYGKSGCMSEIQVTDVIQVLETARYLLSENRNM